MPRTKEQALANLDVHFRRLREDAVYRAKWRHNIKNANRAPQRRAQSSATLRAVNARRVRCEECGMVSSPGAIGRHQAAKGHRGRALVLEPQEWGRQGGAERARLAATDPEFRSLISRAAADSYTPERRDEQADRMRDLLTPEERSAVARAGAAVSNARRYRCDVCGMTTTAGALGTHFKRTGHAGRSKIDS
jgi:hypothetical protein